MNTCPLLTVRKACLHVSVFAAPEISMPAASKICV